MLKLFRSVFTPVYEGEGTGTESGNAEKAAAEKAAAEKAAAEKAAKEGNGTGEDDKPTISQKKLNSLLAEEKRKYQKQIEGQVTQLEELKKAQGLTQQQRDDLQKRIEDLNNSLLSKEELARKERERLGKEHQTALKGVTDERDTWKSRFAVSTINRSIQDEAVRAKAFNPEQIVDLLATKSTLEEVTDAEGKPTGDFITKIRFSDVDKEGRPITLNLTVPEAVKRMKELPDRFGNLFESGLIGGLGGNRQGNTGTGGKKPEDMTPDEYREWRKKPGNLGKSPVRQSNVQTKK
jgi:hypothetical protein